MTVLYTDIMVYQSMKAVKLQIKLSAALFIVWLLKHDELLFVECNFRCRYNAKVEQVSIVLRMFEEVDVSGMPGFTAEASEGRAII